MSTVVVLCPHCRKELKLRDRSKIGQRAKCPSCSQPFELKEESAADEAPLELVEESPAVGVGAQWVPDEPQPPVRGAGASGFPQLQAAPSKSAAMPAGGPIVATGAAAGGIERLKELRRRNAKRRNMAILFGGLTALAIAIAFWALTALRSKEPAPPTAGPAAPQPAGTPVAMAGSAPGGPVAAAGVPSLTIPTVGQGPTPDRPLLPHQELTRTQMRDNALLADRLAPRTGEPIRLYMVPSGINVVIHLRPAKLWSDDPVWTEFRYSLTQDVTDWIAAKLKEVCRREPQQIEECLIVVRLGAIGTEPQIATVVHFAEEARLSDLIEEFAGEPLGEIGSGPRINNAPPWAYLIKDAKTVAIVPEQDRFELPEVILNPNPNASEGVYRLLDLTDSQRAFTVLFEVDDVKRHEGWLFSERAKPAFRHLLDWFGDDVETVGWSVDIQGDSLVSEVLLRNRSVASTTRLVGDTLTRLELLPKDLQTLCLKMHPTTTGFQAIIGRFPAMIEAYREATIPTTDTRHVKLTTVLPRKAAPNLALGTLLTWDLSTQTDFSSAAPPKAVAAAAEVKIPDKVEDRLKELKFEGEFGNIPLQDCLAYIGNETQTKIEIDGNALKDAGFTKNIKIKLNLGQVSGLEAIKQIIQFETCRPPVPEKRMCIVIDEAAKTVLFSTEFFAKEQGKTVYPLITP